jgi:hypothetical protein
MRKLIVIGSALVAGVSHAKPLVGVFHNGFGSLDLIGLLWWLFSY